MCAVVSIKAPLFRYMTRELPDNRNAAEVPCAPFGQKKDSRSCLKFRDPRPNQCVNKCCFTVYFVTFE
jgi:hypothetical protein